ncbi:imelysin family protein [Aliiroseovarius crassostreae]|uniref:imelysin family protein n=1 Tax=Aliiroseovarius crassostreae TaxID=154981 RepID=UPI00220C8864|nr:imelysin family protein [Aliiroseovarius crassostreae]UWP92714.1 imelysin family protein [Aliiroseovarius crassostreae]
MKPFLAIAAACLLPLTGWAGNPDHGATGDRLLGVLQHQFGTFQTHATRLAEEAEGFCAGRRTEEEVTSAFRATWLAWAPLDPYQFGPMETLGAALRVNFFPDKKGFVGRALTQLRRLSAEEQANPAVIARYSVAAQGLPAIERLLFDAPRDAPAQCPVLIGITGQLSATSNALYDQWFGQPGWADLVRSAGPDNPTYLSDQEFSRQMFTALEFSILRMRDHRLKRPLGSYQRAFPKRAEAWRAGLSTRIIAAQLHGMEAVILNGFGPALPEQIRAELARRLSDLAQRLEKIDQPLQNAVEDPLLRVRIEGVISRFQTLQIYLENTVGPALGLQAGFSAGDGD